MRALKLVSYLIVTCFVLSQCGGDVEHATPNGNAASGSAGGAEACPDEAAEAGCAGVNDGLEQFAPLHGSCSRSTVVNRDAGTTACYHIR